MQTTKSLNRTDKAVLTIEMPQKESLNKDVLSRLNAWIGIIYFAFFFFFILLIVNTEQSCFIQQPLFLFDINFLYGYLGYPGGFVDYISLFLSQFYCYPLPGALIITATALAVFIFTCKIINIFRFNRFSLFLQLFPVTSLLYIHSFSDGILSTSLILVFVLMFFFCYLKLSEKAAYIRIAGYSVSSLVIFYGAGGSGLLLFTAMCFSYEIAKFCKRSLPVIFTMVLSGLVPYLTARYLFFITPEQSYLHLLIPERNFRPGIMLYLLYIYYPLFVLLSNIIPKAKKTDKKTGIISLSIQVVIISVLTCLLTGFSLRSGKQFISKVNYLAYKGEWQGILKLTEKKYSPDRIVNFNINRALYFNNSLLYDLFRYPNFWGQHALFLGAYTYGYVTMYNSELFFDLGHIRAARQWAYEAQTIAENSPRVLKMLALTNIIEGDYKAANPVLKILDKSLLYKKWARYYLNGIKDTTLFNSDSLIQAKRKLMPSDIHFMDGRKVEVELFSLLKKSPDNKMALEFLIAYLMLSDQIEKLNIVDLVYYLKQSGYKEIPQTVQEAIMVYTARRGSYNLDSVSGDFKINQAILNAYEDYLDILDKYNMDRMAAREELYYKYGSSYWYYQQYTSPFVNNKDFLEKTIKE